MAAIWRWRKRAAAAKFLHLRQKEREEHLTEYQVRFPTISAKHASILALSLEDLICCLREGNLTAAGVLEAYTSAAVDADRRTNCVVEFLTEATERAAELDNLPEDLRGALHGVPFSVKVSLVKVTTIEAFCRNTFMLKDAFPLWAWLRGFRKSRQSRTPPSSPCSFPWAPFHFAGRTALNSASPSTAAIP